MNLAPSKHTGKRVLRTVFYILAVLVLLLGLFLWYSFSINTPQAIRSSTVIFQNPAFNGIFNQIDNLLRTSGAILLLFNVLLSAALFSLGRLISQNIRLLERLEELEGGNMLDSR